MLTFLDVKCLDMIWRIVKSSVLRIGGLVSSASSLSCHRTWRDPKMMIANPKTREKGGGVAKGLASSSSSYEFRF